MKKADGSKQLDKAILQAKQENKYVFAMVGGNWCKWCLMFNEFATTNQNVKNAFDKSYIFLHINWSKANKNEEAMKRLGYPERFGFPVFVILNEKGERVHTQNSAYLEQGEGYNEKRSNSLPKPLDKTSGNSSQIKNKPKTKFLELYSVLLYNIYIYLES